MSKKHFIALAETIIHHNRFSSEPFTEGQISVLADFCGSENPNFKRDRWLSFIAGEVGPNGGTVRDIERLD